MNKKQKRYTLTAALPYANGPIHLGHLAGAYLPADMYARFLRAQGHEVLFVCGSDEHGVPITLKARAEGVSPQEVVDRYHQQIQQSFADFGISFDHYSRTSGEKHREVAQGFFADLNAQGVFERNRSEQFYDPQEKQFLADRYLTGECPKCKHNDVYRDQCEKCGSNISQPRDLDKLRSTLSGVEPILKETEHWYLPFDEQFLSDWIDQKKDWKPNVLGQVKSWIDGGLRPRAVTRDLDWGVPVPVEDAQGKVLYVWFDAPIGYISATQEWAEANGKNWRDFWQEERSELIHFIGKDNIVFHCLIFPMMLKNHSENYILPTQVPANEFLNLEDDKISTSKGWAIWLHEYLKDFPNQQDVLRYVLCSNLPETKDNNFTWKDFQTKNNSELVGILGNFVNRVLVLTHKYYGGEVPNEKGDFSELDAALTKSEEAIDVHLETFKFRDALFEFMNLARIGNKFLQDNEPWKLQKTNPDAVRPLMSKAFEIVLRLQRRMEPFLPETRVKLSEQTLLNLIYADELPALHGHSIGEAALLFTRIEDEEVSKQLEKLERTKEVESAMKTEIDKTVAPQKAECTYEDFQKIDLAVGTILSAEKVEKADRLLKFEVNTGVDVRTIVSGVAEHFAPEETIGKKVTVLLNLAPRKIRGVVSQGMLLFAEDANGRLHFVNPESEEARNGNRIT